MRKKEAPKIKLQFGLRMRFLCLAIITAFLMIKLQSYERVKLSSDQFEMSPAINPGQTVFLYKHKNNELYLSKDIIYYKKDDENEYHFARIIAKDQGKVEIKNQNLFFNGDLHAPTKDSFPGHVNKSYDLNFGDFFIVQDQQGSHWMDSIAVGPMKSDKIVIRGKIFFYMSQVPDSE